MAVAAFAGQIKKESAAWRRKTSLYIIALSAFVVLISAGFFMHESLRLDEAQSLWQTSRSASDILRTVAEDVHLPLYHFLLFGWRSVFGSGVVAVRLLSLIFFLASLPAIYRLGTVAFGRNIGRFAVLLAAISPFLNWYGNETRMYTLLLLFVVLSHYFFMRIMRQERDDTPPAPAWAGYLVTSAVGMYVHYFFGFVLLSQAIYFIFGRKNFPRGSFMKFVAVAGIVILLFSPWIVYVQSLGSASNTRPEIEPPTSINVFNSFSQFMFGFQTDKINTLLLSFWPVLVLVAFLMLQGRRAVSPEAAYFMTSIIVPMVAVFSLSYIVQPLFLSRYLIVVLPSFYIVLAWMISLFPRTISVPIRVFVVAMMLLTLGIEIANAKTPVKEDYREVSEYLERNAGSRDLIIVSAPFTVYPIEYYYDGNISIETLPRWNRHARGPIPPFKEEDLPAEVASLRGRYDSAWIVLSYDQGYEEKIRLYMDMNLERLEMKEFSPGLVLYRYKLTYYRAPFDDLVALFARERSAERAAAQIER